ncbi:MAG TPA: FxSxx-COOH system tetratricopeptide repeat protein [Ktedonobacteraceae bacterium]
MSVPVIAPAICVFFSYATNSRKDTCLFHRLRKHLSNLRQQQLINAVDSAHCSSEQLARSLIDAAQVVVLLISADYLDLDRCAQVEMTRALERHRSEGLHLVPVLLSPTELQGSPLEQFTFLPADNRPVSARASISIEHVLVEVAREIRKVVEKLSRPVAQVEPRPAQNAIPYRRNVFFTDREAILSLLHDYFSTAWTFKQTRIQALTGLVGIGKTQIAVEYIYRHRDEYQTVFWIEADTGNLTSAIRSLAGRCAFSVQDCEDEQRLYTALRHWLGHHDEWLLVLDGLDDLPLINRFVPFESSGHVLVTTLSQATGYMAHPVAVEALSDEDGVLFLLRRVRIIGEQAGSADVPEPVYSAALAIAREMGRLALALDQAGAYIEETHCSLTGYLRAYRRQGAALLALRGHAAHTHRNSVKLALLLTFEKVAELCPEAMSLLRLFAFLHPDAIPGEIIEEGGSALDGPLRVLRADTVALDRAMATLLKFSLIQRRSDTTMLSIHRVVQTVLKEGLTTRQQRQWASRAVRLVSAVFPQAEFSTWASCETYLAQARRCAGVIADLRLTVREAVPLLQRLGSYCYQRAWYQEAERYLKSALGLCERSADAETDRAQVLNSLALLYHRQGNYPAAETAHQCALSLREGAWGAQHCVVAQTLNNLALLYQDWGRDQEAEALYRRVLAIDEHTLGPGHPDTATSLSNLALLYDRQGAFAQAEPLFERAFAIEERTLDTRHPDLALSLNMQASRCAGQGDYQEAERLYRRALAIQEQVLGFLHPDTARTLSSLADLYEEQQRYPEAEALYLQALSIYKQVLGPQHPDTASVLNNQAYLLRQQERYGEAEVLYLQALHIYEHTPGPQHPDTASVLNNLGCLYYLMQHYERAEVYLQRGLDICERVLGQEHPDTGRALNALTELLIQQQRYEQAGPLYQRVLRITSEVLGPEHADTTFARQRYAFLLARIAAQKEQP